MGDDSSGGGWIKWFIGILVTLAVGVAVPVYLSNREHPTPASSNANLQPNSIPTLPSLNVPGLGFDPTKPANLYANKTSGPAGSAVLLSGDGFKPGEEIVFSMQATDVGRTKADTTGAFKSVSVTVPTFLGNFPGTQFQFSANGRESIKHATADFVVSG